MIALTLLVACQPPPPAPEGLDASTVYLFREFYREDAVFAAGLTGLLDWYEGEGSSLVGERADVDNTDAFTLLDLAPDDVAHLPLEELDGGRDVADAAGVVSLSDMACTWKEAEAWLVREDQHVVFEGNFEAYQREFLTDRKTFEDAEGDGEFTEITEDLDRFGGAFDGTSTASSLLLTENLANPAPLLGVDVPAYPMGLDLRHGVYDLDGESTPVMAILTWVSDETYDDKGENGLRQSYSIEVNYARGDRTLRVFAAWAEPVSSLFSADDAFVLNYAVNTSQDAAERLSKICAGEVEIPPEP